MHNFLNWCIASLTFMPMHGCESVNLTIPNIYEFRVLRNYAQFRCSHMYQCLANKSRAKSFTLFTDCDDYDYDDLRSENPGNVKRFITIGIHVIRNFAESERFPHADFATYSSWSHGFTRLTNHRPLGLEVRIHCYTIDNRQWTFWLSKFPRNFAARTFRPGTCSKKVNRVHLDFMLI